MLSAIIENTVTKEDEYLYLKKENNNLIYYGFSIQNSNVKPIDKNIINKIYDLLRVNNKCLYIEDYLGYKVYLDKENNIKHYLKNGIEDFIMLFKNNGEDLNLYSNIDDLEDLEFQYISDGKKFKIEYFVVKLTLSSLISLLTLLIPSSVEEIFTEINYNIPKIVYSISNYLNLDLHYIDYKEAIELISSSELSDIQKEIATNEILLKDIFEYYKGNNMEYVIKSRLDGLKTEIYSKDEGIKNGNIGYYSTFNPNVLHIREDVEGEDTFKHEYIHLFQSCNCEYMYLVEATAKIVSYEYLDGIIDSYIQPVNNTRLLMDVVGPKIVWETVFGGDDTNLVNIIKNNLNESEAEELISYLKQEPKKIDEENKHERITELISNLYKNINLIDIYDDAYIYDFDKNYIEKIYFNEDKMKESETLFCGIETAIKSQLITPIYEELYLKEISEERYLELKEELENNSEYQAIKNDIANAGMIDEEYYARRLNKVKNVTAKYTKLYENIELQSNLLFDYVIYKIRYNEVPISMEKALEMGLVTAKYYEIVNGKDLTESEKATYEWYSNILLDCRVNKENVFLYSDENGIYNQVEYKVPTIKEMFPDQTIRNNSNMIK